MLRCIYKVQKYTKIKKTHYQQLRDVISPTSFNLYPSSLYICYSFDDSAIFLDNECAFGMLSDLFGGFWTINSKESVDKEKINSVIDFIRLNGSTIREFRNVPEHQAMSLTGNSDFIIREENSSQHQYVYKTSDFIGLNGSDYSKIRREIKKFLDLYSNEINIKEASNWLGDTEKLLSYKKLYDGWHEFGSSGAKDSADEEYTFNNFLGLRAYPLFQKALIIEIWYGQILVAISINDIISDKYAINYFHISNLNLSGISYYLFYVTCKMLHDRGVDYLNFQEDCGIQGLRDFKNQLRPCKLEKQYSITINNF